MKKVIITALYCLLIPGINAQQTYTDSLRLQLSSTIDPLKKFDLLNKIGESLFTGGSMRPDSSVCTRMLQIARDLSSDSLLAISYDWVGNYFSWTSNFNTALEYFLKGVPLAQKVNDKRRLSSLYLDISVVFNSNNNPGDEFKYLQLAARSLPDKNSPFFPFMDIQVKTLLSKYYLFQGKPDSALHYAQAANDINFNLKSYFFDAMINSILAGVHEQLGDLSLSEVYYKKAVAAEHAGYGFVPGIYSPKILYAGFLLKNNRLPAAKSLALECMKGSIEIKNNELGVAASGKLHNIYHQSKMADSAYYYSRLESSLRDSVFNEEKVYRIQSLAFAEQLRIRDEELKNLKLNEKRRREIQYLIIGISITGLCIIFLMLSHSIVANEAMLKFIGIIGLLIMFEFINLLLHPFLEKITQHNSILMLAAMVGIAAMLIPIHHRLEKWAIHRLVEKNKRIRLAAAKKTIEQLEKK